MSEPQRKQPRVLSDFDEIALRLGWAIDRWGGAEIELASVYVHALAPKDIMAAYDAFYSVTSFHGKLRMTAAAIERTLAPSSPLRDQWKDIKNRLRSANERRNRLAHGRMMHVFFENLNGVFWFPFYRPEALHYAAHPTKHKHLDLNKIEYLTPADIGVESDKFEALAREVEKFSGDVRAEINGRGRP